MTEAGIEKAASTRKRGLITISALAFGAAAISSAATQFVAYRVGYHPALGASWVGHFYAPWSWVEWQQAPWAPHAGTTFRIVDSVLMATATIGMLAVMCISIAHRRRPIRHEGVYGTARFQTEREIRLNGLLPRRGQSSAGVYIGGWTGARGGTHYLRHDGPEHCIVIAPTRSGKGVGNIVPTLLSWPSSCLVYDEKAELWEMTAGWRAQHADNVVVRWEPAAVAGSAGFNFLEEVRLGTPHEVADAQNIALALCDPQGKGIDAADHWGRTSFDLITALILHELYRARAQRRTASLADVAQALSDPDKKSDQLWEEMRTNRHLVTKAHALVAGAGRDMQDREARERGSVLSSAKTYLLLFKDPIVAENTRRSEFRLLDLMNHHRPVSLYIVTRGADKERLRPVVRLLLTMAMRVLTAAELKFKDGQPLMPHRHRLLMMLDEFPSLGRLQLLEDILPKCAGYGIKAFLAAQDREQMLRAYGQHQSITANCHVRIVYAPNEWSTAKWVSEMAGNTTIVKEDVTESGTRFGPLRNVSRTYHQLSRPLVSPDEIMKLRKPVKDGEGRIRKAGDMVVFVAGEPPIAGTQILYFLDRIFIGRAAIPAPRSGSTVQAAMVFQAGRAGGG
ncbi:MAG: type IV secretory system conjugative DNA transfer family protein [Alphaproteobacteria bacterium]|nr:type IV secretory system conjugative DNA transfer family protein [Alphaproteobacteria bacterium]